MLFSTLRRRFLCVWEVLNNMVFWVSNVQIKKKNNNKFWNLPLWFWINFQTSFKFFYLFELLKKNCGSKIYLLIIFENFKNFQYEIWIRFLKLKRCLKHHASPKVIYWCVFLCIVLEPETHNFPAKFRHFCEIIFQWCQMV